MRQNVTELKVDEKKVKASIFMKHHQSDPSLEGGESLSFPTVQSHKTPE